jgi:tyrosyl-tRNA synthetase
MDEVGKILKGSPRDAKVRLAKEIVTLYHSEGTADAAEKHFDTVFKDGGTPDDIPGVKAKKESSLIDVLVEEGLVGSKSDARRMIEQGGVKKDDAVVDSIDAKAEVGVYKVGKRKFIKLI